MTRRFIGFALLAMIALPYGFTVLLVGCCATRSEAAPMATMSHCQTAAGIIEGEQTPAGESTPVRSREREPEFRSVLSKALDASASTSVAAVDAARAASARHRVLVRHGALRCETDVGLNVLLETYRI